ncbi:MAG: quinone-dependent dihydroorotate dehydrogenase [Balneolaceae bacterium]
MYKTCIRPLLFRFPSDRVHESTIRWATDASESALYKRFAGLLYNYQSADLSQEFWGLTFRNPAGLAAGFDKNGTLIPIMEATGFGFVEVGSITASPSTGNPKPRSFRLPKDNSLINRMGLNNDGAATITKRLKKAGHRIPVGVNIAKTHDPSIMGDEALEDYLESFLLAREVADYLVINISCPNTREGKTFEEPEELNRLLGKLQIRNDLTAPPVLIKLSSDLESTRLNELLEISKNHAVSGFVATNTSSGREGLTTPKARLDEIGNGGLSGRAIREKSTSLIRQIHEQMRGECTIIGAGGIQSPEDAIEKLKAGADLLQIYTGLIYEGPALVKRINRGIHRYMKRNGLKEVYQIRM